MKLPWMHRLPLSANAIRGLDATTIGIACGIVATIGYTLTGIILRDLARNTDPYWVSCIKAIPTLVAALWLIARRQRRADEDQQPVVIPWRLMPLLFVIGAVVQIGGNAGSQWAFEIVGLAVTIPLMFGTLIIGSAAIGVLMFNERLTQRTMVAIALLIFAVVVLKFAVPPAEHGDSIRSSVGISLASLGVLVACLSGLAYALSHAAIRKYNSPQLPLSVTLAVFSVAGIVVLGGMTVARIGWTGMLETNARQWWGMWAAGIVNAIAYFALGRAILTLPLVQVNVITASQVALTAVAGIALFGEPASLPLVLGVALTICGLMIQGRRRSARQTANRDKAGNSLSADCPEAAKID